MTDTKIAWGDNAWIHKPTDIYICGKFIVSSGSPIAFGEDVTGKFNHNHIYSPWLYTPRMLRRPRLRRFAPVARRALTCRALWRWLGETNAHGSR
jgi:hypothetical protein